MSQNHDDNATAGGFAFLIAGMLLASALVALGLAFIAFVFTLICAWAWLFDTPIAMGSVRIDPRQARAFIVRGVAFAFLVPLFTVFMAAIFKWHVGAEVWPYLVVGGYVLGSVGI